MNGRGHDSQRGAALLFVLLMVAVLSGVVVQGLRTAQVEAVSSSVARHQAQASSLADSGLIFAAGMLAEDAAAGDEDHTGEEWSLYLGEGSAPLEFETGQVEVEMLDESGKIPLNAMNSETSPYAGMLERLLLAPPYSMDAEQADLLVAALVDWIDGNDEPTGYDGAEDLWYLGLDEPYQARDGAIQSLAELGLVRHMDEKLLHGSEEAPPLTDFVTVYGEGPITINTAPYEVLVAMVADEEGQMLAADLAADIVLFRAETEDPSLLADPDWYRTQLVGYSEVEFPAGTSDVKSGWFSLRLTATAGMVNKRMYAVLARETTGEGETTVRVHYRQVF